MVAGLKKWTIAVIGVILSFALFDFVSYSETGAKQENSVERVNDVIPVRLSIDTNTKGKWIGKYGGESAILFGYRYPSESANALTADRTTIAKNDYNLIIDGSASPCFNGISFEGVGTFWCYKASDENTVLEMPMVEDAGGVPFSAYFVNNTYTPSNITTGYQENYYYSAVVLTMNDTNAHMLTLYSDYDHTDNDIHISISDGTNILISDILEKGTFNAGAYVTYPIVVAESGEKIYVSFGADERQKVGISAVFLDEPIGNATQDLNASISTQQSRTIDLTWKEDGILTKVMVMRKTGDNGAWEKIAEIQPSVCSYQDSSLKAGETYHYTLVTQNDTGFSNANEIKTCRLEVYSETQIQLDANENMYTVENSDTELSISAVLKNTQGENIAVAGLPLKLTLDYGHNIQTFIANTNENGEAVFAFKPDYLGYATINVEFKDDDTNKLSSSITTGTLFVGEMSWTKAPVLYRVSDGIMPNDLINLNGYGLMNEDVSKVRIKYTVHSSDEIGSTPPQTANELEIIDLDEKEGAYLVTRLPESAVGGVYDIWVTNGYGWSCITLNAARPLFISEYEAWEGQTITISGRNFQASQFAMANQSTKVRLVGENGGFEQDVTKVTPYSVKFDVSEATQKGNYSVEVSNDSGVTWRAAECGQLLTVIEKGADPLNLGLAWADHFNWNDTYNITESAYGADGSDELDDTDAIQAAIDAAASGNGGVVFIPNGTYYITTLKLPARVVLLGESTEKTILLYRGEEKGVMVESDGMGRTEGRQGIANISFGVVSADAMPNQFVWFGHEWDSARNNAELRTASEFFIKNAHFVSFYNYETTTPAEIVIIADERFSIQDCEFHGFGTNIGAAYVNRYLSYTNNLFDFEKGSVKSTADYSFIENNTVIGGKYKGDVSFLGQDHGIFFKARTHVENNIVKDMGNNTNVGEAYCAEAPSCNFNYGQVVDADQTSVKYIMNQMCSGEKTVAVGRGLSVMITSGRGMGQLRDVANWEEINFEEFYAGNYCEVQIVGEWDVVPDSTSVVVLFTPLDWNTIYNCSAIDCNVAASFYADAYDSLAANIYSEQGGSITVCAYNTNGQKVCPGYYVTIRDNIIKGVGTLYENEKVNRIFLYTTRYTNKGSYYTTSIQGAEIRNNQLYDDPMPLVEEQIRNGYYHEGIMLCATTYGGNLNSDGSVGDIANVIIENNYLTNFEYALTTPYESLGVILKGNRFRDNKNDMRDDSADSLVITDSGNTKGVLEKYVNALESMDISTFHYSDESISAYYEAIEFAKTVLKNESATQDEVEEAYQNLKYLAGRLAVERSTDYALSMTE